MNRWIKRATLFAFSLVVAGAAINDARADEGMWLFSNPPVKQMKEKYGVDVSPELLEHLQKSCLKFANSGSASFVSSNGLILTNHHVGLSTVAGLSTKENDLVAKGFYAENFEDELKCPGLKLVCLQEIVDVTDQVAAATKDCKTVEETEKARADAIKKIETDAKAEKGLRCEVVPMYQGGQYHLYCYKEFTDVRLVFTPEESVGFFGGDPDNFGYPRYNLDVTIFRAYENDKPYRPEHFLQWSENGAQDGEFVLVAGHPARTNRFNTVADLQYQRDTYYPHMMNKYRRREVLYQTFASYNDENKRRIATDLFKIQNSRKNRGGILLGQQTPKLMQEKIDAENELRRLAAEKKVVDLSGGDPWDNVAKAMKAWAPYYVAYDLFEGGEAVNCTVMGRARAIVRYASETAKPEAERSAGYKDAVLEERRKELNDTLKRDDADIEALKLGDNLAMLYELSQPAESGRTVGAVLVPQTTLDAIYAGKSPNARAAEIVRDTKLSDEAFRKSLVEGGLDAVKASDDPAIQLALAIEPLASDLRDLYNTTVAEPSRQNYAKIASARFAVYGDTVYPDATFTLRLTYGKVGGYTEDDGTVRPFQTVVKGALDHAREHNFVDPFDLAQSWVDAEKEGRAPLDAPLNFVTNQDIIGGNSGSPCVNAKGEVVGLIFDGNIQSLVLNFIFDEVQARAVLVHSTGIREVIRSIYKAPKLADEFGK
ncbi:MAG: S46 family peptidase [Thermoguttaceae bacterium]|nr:S46 family peptidase [Thermoguttaceae bacterium]